MKLQQSEKHRRLSEDAGRGRSASFHHGVDNEKVVARGQRGSTSSSVFRLSADFTTDFKLGGGCKPVSDGGSSSNDGGGRKFRRSFGQRLISGIKNVFRVSSFEGTKGESESKVQISREDEEEGEDLYGEEEEKDGDGDIVVMRRNQLYVN